MKLLKKYFKVIHEIYEYFDYLQDDKNYTIEDYTDCEWSKTKTSLHYWIDEDDDPIEDEYIEEYIGEEFTMYLIQDSLNLDDCLVIFDNKKFLTEEDYRN